MTDIPNIGTPEWFGPQATPWVTVNQTSRALAAFALRVTVVSRFTAAPPGTCSDGDCYWIPVGATGDWAPYEGLIAVAVGANASNGWIYVPIEREGAQVWIGDEQIQLEYLNGSWAETPNLAKLGETAVDGAVLTWDLSNGGWFAAPPL